uniref:Uncharacterized protein LOC104244589 n=1 Tax=Nicotiana sylvestris TaxID=4096 RepID=A0A1U7Y2K6_NICSY|nr:PREDICTED: uncharacterized protein LOC104244589 [Nicotiana sylvestris]
MPTSSSQPPKHPFMHSFESIHAQDPPNIGVDNPPTTPCIDSESVTQPPIHAQDPPNVGRLDDLGRLIIVPDKARLHPCTQATKSMVESMCSFYHGPWRFWSDVPWNIRDRMFDEFRMKCAWPVEHEVEVRGIFFKKCADRLTDMLREAQNKKEIPGWINEDIWTKLTKYWASEEFKKKNELAKATRLSDKGGSMHTGDSISIGAHRRRLSVKHSGYQALETIVVVAITNLHD